MNDAKKVWIWEKIINVCDLKTHHCDVKISAGS